MYIYIYSKSYNWKSNTFANHTNNVTNNSLSASKLHYTIVKNAFCMMLHLWMYLSGSVLFFAVSFIFCGFILFHRFTESYPKLGTRAHWSLIVSLIVLLCWKRVRDAWCKMNAIHLLVVVWQYQTWSFRSVSFFKYFVKIWNCFPGIVQSIQIFFPPFSLFSAIGRSQPSWNYPPQMPMCIRLR